MSPDLAQWLMSLDGLRSMATVLHELAASDLEADEALRTLSAAIEAGAIDDAAAMPDSWRLLDQAQRLAAMPDHSAAMLTYGDIALANRLIEARQRTLVCIAPVASCLTETTLQPAVSAAMTAAGLTVTSRTADADLTVFIGIHPVIGAEVAAIEFEQPKAAHLFVAAYGDRAIAGPLVVPGRTSCLRCAYLHTRDADPHWTGVSMQLHTAVTRLPQAPVDRLLALLTAAQAARLARRWVDHPNVVNRWRDLAYELRLPDAHVTLEARPPHPLCNCRWLSEGGPSA